MHPEYHEDKFRPHKIYDQVVIYFSPSSIAHCVFEGDRIYMRNVLVHENYQNQGIGRQMMIEIKEAYPQYSICSDYTESSKGFWKKMEAEDIIDEIVHEQIDFDYDYPSEFPYSPKQDII